MSPRDHHRGRTDPASRPRSRTRSRTRSPDTTDRTDRHRSRRHHHHRHRHDDQHDDHHRRHTDTHRDRHNQDEDRDRDRHRRHRHHHHSSSHRTPDTAQATRAPRVLPYGSRELTKHDLTTFTPLFAMYLDIQKGLYLEDLPEDEVKGRWKSFIRKWNHGELAEGWYDPAMLERARSNLDDAPRPPPAGKGPQSSTPTAHNQQTERHHSERNCQNTDDSDDNNEDNEEDDYGPTLPQPDKSLSGPTIPTIQDLELRKEQAREDALAARQDSQSHYRSEVRSHRAELRHMQEEVAPRAEPGTHERRMEKRQEAAQANRAFAEARRGGSPGAAAVPDEDLMGSGENELEAIKKSREREQRKKNERELRREEIMRARAAEREERLQKYRAKEEETIGWLKTLAKQRFG